MPQVVRTTNDVILNSLYLLGELGVGETPDAFMLSTGLDLLNELLDKFASDSIYIPFLTTLTFVMVPGQDVYSISDMITGTDIIADRIVDLSFANYIVPGVGATLPGNQISFNFTASSATSQLTFGSTAAFPTGTPVTVASTGTLPAPLIPGVTYYVINLTPTIVYLALTQADAQSGYVIPLTTSGTGVHTITTVLGVPVNFGTSLNYPITILEKSQYYGVVRQTGLVARPGFCFLNKQDTESFVTFYPAPDQPYPCQLQVKCMINSLQAQDTLGELPPNYYGFLKYSLARKFLSYYPSGNWPQTAEDEYQDYYMTLKNANETDLTIRPSVTLTAPEPFLLGQYIELLIMPVQDFQIVGSFNHQRVIPFDPERSVNLFEYIDPLGKKPKALLSTAGLDLRITFGTTGGSRGTFVFKGVGESETFMYQVFGFNAYRIDSFLTPTLIFTFTSSSNTSIVRIDANTHQVIFVDGQQGWIWDTLTSTATQITDASFPVKPIDVCTLDGFFVVANGDTNQFQLSMFNQGLVWGSLGYSATFTGSAASDTLIMASTALYATGVPFEVTTTGTLPTPLVINTTYYSIRINATTIQVAATFQDAIAGIFIPLGTDGTPVNTINGTGQLQQGQINSHPGNIVACRTLHRRLFLFSLNFTEVWENQGIGANLPFRRVNSLLLEYGTPALGSVSTGFDKMFFLSQDQQGLGSVMEVEGTSAVPVSNRALDFILAQYAELEQIEDARGFLIKENGIIFYRLNFTLANHTYVYDVTLSDPTREEGKLWHEEEVLNGDRHPAQTHGFFLGKNYVGSYFEPKTFHVDSAFLTNDGQPIRRMRITRPFVPPGYQRLRIDRFQVDLLQGDSAAQDVTFTDLFLLTESGLEITTEDGISILLEQEQSQQGSGVPVLFLSLSKDGGQTFGYLQTAPMGAVGQRSFRTLWRKLGTIPRGQAFVAKLEFFDVYPLAIMGASWAVEVLPE